MITSNKKVEKLQEELDSVQADVSTFTLLLESFAKTNTAKYSDDTEILKHLNCTMILNYYHYIVDTEIMLIIYKFG